jgi:hypothetical protein
MHPSPSPAQTDSTEDLLAELNHPPAEPMTRAEWLLVGISIALGLVLLASLAWWVQRG